MSSTKIIKKISELSTKLEAYNTAYYVEDKPLVSDAEYDELFRKLESLEKEYPELKLADSPTQRVGAAPLEKFSKYKHELPMLSLANAMDEEEFQDFHSRLIKLIGDEKRIQYYCDLKFDGLSISLVYENGYLVKAATRGDGRVGEEVTNNIRTIKNIPLRLKAKAKELPQKIEIRGEVIFPIKSFQELNRSREAEGEALFANPRNAAAGSVRQLDSKLTAKRDLKIFAYTIGAYDSKWKRPDSQAALADKLIEWGFENYSPRKLCKSHAAAWKYFAEISKKRESLKFDIDGVVIKLDSIKLQEILGNVGKNPRSMIACKFPPRQEQTVVENIEIQVGRTGALSPVAILKPVNVHGVMVGRASLHNKEEIKRKDIRIGDWVLVQRAGDVIPEVVKVVEEKRKKGSKKFVFPKNCPSCDYETVDDESGITARCMNPKCPAQNKEKIEHFVSKSAMNIEGLGPRIVELLLKESLIKSASDLYLLKADQLIELEGFKEKSVSNLLEGIERSKQRDLDAFIYALGIRHVGVQLARTLSEHYTSISELSKSKLEDLVAIDDVGEVVANSIFSFFQDKENLAEIKSFIKAGIDPVTEKKDKSKQAFFGKLFVLTGTLPTLSRAEASKLITDRGGKVSSSISKKTTYLLAGENAGSKLEKANKLNIQVISESDFLKIVQ